MITGRGPVLTRFPGQFERAGWWLVSIRLVVMGQGGISCHQPMHFAHSKEPEMIRLAGCYDSWLLAKFAGSSGRFELETPMEAAQNFGRFFLFPEWQGTNCPAREFPYRKSCIDPNCLQGQPESAMSPVTHDALAEYIRVELELGFTFASIATNPYSEEAFSRNREHVRRVCQTVRHFMGLAPEHRRFRFFEMLKGLEDKLHLLDSQR